MSSSQNPVGYVISVNRSSVDGEFRAYDYHLHTLARERLVPLDGDRLSGTDNLICLPA